MTSVVHAAVEFDNNWTSVYLLDKLGQSFFTTHLKIYTIMLFDTVW